MKTLLRAGIFLLIFFSACSVAHKNSLGYAGSDWSSYAADNTKSRYSTLTQINLQNVQQLKVVWAYSGDFSDSLKTTNECNPVDVDGVLYASTSELKLLVTYSSIKVSVTGK